MKCPSCSTDTTTGAKFCGQCGTALPRACPSCGHGNPPANRFCAECGANLVAQAQSAASQPPQPRQGPVAAPRPAQAAERRQITVLFCDMVGSSALSTRLDPEVQREVVGNFQACCAAEISRFDGMVAQYLGDGVLAYFGYPTAHEDDAERAVRAGLGLIDAIANLAPAPGVRLQTRVGIATGLVVVGDLVREGVTQQNAAIGVTTNLAARLQAMAEPDCVLIAPDTYHLLGGLFEYRDLGLQKLKGFDEPARVRQVVRASGVENRFEAHHSKRLSPLLGRDEELDLLLRRWEHANSGAGRFILITGEAGIGKSSITYALQQHVEPGRHTLLYHCSPYHLNSPFHSIINQIARAAAIHPSDTADSKLDKLHSLLGSAPAEDIALFAALLSCPGGTRYPLPTLTPELLRERTVAAVLAHLSRLASERPVLAIFEDLHWADPTTLELLALAISQIRTERVLLLATARPEFTPPWPSHRHTSTINLTRLDRTEAEALVAGVAGAKPLPPAVLQQIVARADGIPLFIEELTKNALESNLLHEAGDSQAGPLPGMLIPSTLHASLLARLDRLHGAKEVAQIGAVIGREFTYGAIAAAAGLPKSELGRALTQLVAAELIFQRGVAPHAVYQFKHALVQDAAYDTLLKSRREELHGKIARALEANATSSVEPAILAHHYTQAGLPDPASAHWLAAGRASFSKFALAEAVRQLRLGLDQLTRLPPGPEKDRRELHTQITLGNVFIQAKGLAAPDTEAAFERAYSLRTTLDRSRELIPILFGILIVRLIGGRPLAALDVAQDMLLSTEGERQAELIAKTMAMDVHFWLGNFETADRYYSEALQIYDDDTDATLIKAYAFDMKSINLLYASHFQWMMGYPDRALATKKLLDSWTERLDTPFMYAFAYQWGATVFQYRGQLEDFRSQLEQAHSIATRVGFPTFVRQSELWLAWTRTVEGDLSPGNLAQIEAHLAHLAATGIGATIPYARALYAEALASQGRTSQALTILQEIIVHDGSVGQACHAAEIHRIRASVLLNAGPERHRDAEMDLNQSLAIARRQKAKSWELRTATTYARWLRDQGRGVEARALLQPVYEWFTEGFDTRDLKAARALLEEF
jgi:class 3 adenylate cyclase/predicted ATPase